MLKALCKNLVWVAVPLGLAVGCASNEASYAPETSVGLAIPGNDMTLAPTSSNIRTRVYAEGGTHYENTSSTFSTDVNIPPPGANPETWALAQEIQWKLISDPTLAPMGSALIAEVGNGGVVTLHGAVASTDEQQRVCDNISGLPGVKSVNNQLTIGRASTSGSLNTEQPQPQ